MRDLKAILLRSEKHPSGGNCVVVKVSGRKRCFLKQASRWGELCCGGCKYNLPPNLVKALNAIV